jgi:hypothetical protein
LRRTAPSSAPSSRRLGRSRTASACAATAKCDSAHFSLTFLSHFSLTFWSHFSLIFCVCRYGRTRRRPPTRAGLTR